jgi:hypothetical protein
MTVDAPDARVQTRSAGICAYCDQYGRLTREHVFPLFLLRRRPKYRTFVDHSRGSMVVKSPPTVRDICSKCNGGELSALDGYGKALDDQYFATFVEVPVSVTFSYSYDELCARQ